MRGSKLPPLVSDAPQVLLGVEDQCEPPWPMSWKFYKIIKNIETPKIGNFQFLKGDFTTSMYARGETDPQCKPLKLCIVPLPLACQHFKSCLTNRRWWTSFSENHEVCDRPVAKPPPLPWPWASKHGSEEWGTTCIVWAGKSTLIGVFFIL